MAERDYVLGTDDEEIERLGLQHLVWRRPMLDAWRRAGITRGTRVRRRLRCRLVPVGRLLRHVAARARRRNRASAQARRRGHLS